MKRFLYLAIIGLLAVSCEKPLLDEAESKQKEGGNVTMSFHTNIPYTRSTTDAAESFSKLNLMLFTPTKEKVFTQVKTQNSDDFEFGTFSFNLAAGNYIIVAIGHSGEKSASISSPEKVSFTSVNGRKNTDTFYYYGTASIEDEPKVFSLTMNRGTAMFRLILTDSIMPTALASFKFTMTGGSADINPSTGVGCTNSTQNEVRDIASDNTYEIYTFPKANPSKVKITVNALDANGDVIKQRVFENVSVTRNEITQYSGTFFSGDEGSITETQVGFRVNSDWGATNEYTF